MCGICGIVGRADPGTLDAMMRAIRHRGPDDQGTLVDGRASLGHVRLSIIDLSDKGRNPIYNEDRSLAIFLNGEIYNYRELRSGLEERGHRFSSRTDTEVILHLYEEQRERALDHLNGMFALAIYDLRAGKLFLARDRLGMKPLYYHRDPSGKFLAFASEIKALLQIPGFRVRANMGAVEDYLTFQNVLDDATFFHGVSQLLPGCWMETDGSATSIQSYWEPEFQERDRPFPEIVEEFREVFGRSVARHMISDVPVGSYLSGGLDSGAVSLRAAEISRPTRLSTFTGRFREGGIYDELPMARKIVAGVAPEIFPVEIGPDDFVERLRTLTWHLDEPRVGLAAYSAQEVARLASGHVKVVLTGHGGDEMFAGYPGYKAAHFSDRMRANPVALLDLGRAFRWSEIPRAAYFLFYPWLNPRVADGLFVLFGDRLRRRLLLPDVRRQLEGHLPYDSLDTLLKGRQLSRFQRMRFLQLKTYLPSMLMVEDKIDMQFSMEGRMPFCDRDLVQFALSIPPPSLLRGQQLKSVMVHGLEGTLPAEALRQKKLGFPTPFSAWLRGPLRRVARDLLLGTEAQTRGVFDPKETGAILDAHARRSGDTLFDQVAAARIWSLLSVEMWFRVFKPSTS